MHGSSSRTQKNSQRHKELCLQLQMKRGRMLSSWHWENSECSKASWNHTTSSAPRQQPESEVGTNLLSHRNPRNVSTFNSLDKSSLMDRTSTSTFSDWCYLKSQQLQEHLPCQRDLVGRRTLPWWMPQKPPGMIPSGLCPRMSASFTEWIPFPEWIHRWGNVKVFRAVTVPGVAFVFLIHFIMNFSGLACCLLQIKWRSPLWYHLG